MSNDCAMLWRLIGDRVSSITSSVSKGAEISMSSRGTMVPLLAVDPSGSFDGLSGRRLAPGAIPKPGGRVSSWGKFSAWPRSRIVASWMAARSALA